MLDDSMLHSMYELVGNMWVHADSTQTQGQYAKGILVVIGQWSLTNCKCNNYNYILTVSCTGTILERQDTF